MKKINGFFFSLLILGLANGQENRHLEHLNLNHQENLELLEQEPIDPRVAELLREVDEEDPENDLRWFLPQQIPVEHPNQDLQVRLLLPALRLPNRDNRIHLGLPPVRRILFPPNLDDNNVLEQPRFVINDLFPREDELARPLSPEIAEDTDMIDHFMIINLSA